MMTKKRLMVLTLLICGILQAGGARADETALFTATTAPDALLLLDLSGSMAWNPAGDDAIYGSTLSCAPDETNCKGTGCIGGYCASSKSATTYYSSGSCSTPDPVNCVGTGCSNGFCASGKTATTVYASSPANTADVANCRGAACGRTDGFCNSAVPAGVTYYAHSSCTTPDTYNCRYSENWSDCRNGFCASSHYSSWSGRSCQVQCQTTGCESPINTSACNTQCTSGGCTVNCSRLAIAKRSVFSILDDNDNGNINSQDETSLGVRLGYMRFYNCSEDDTGNSYSDGCNRIVKEINSSYSSINTAVQAESASGGTPLISALKEAKLYLDAHKAADAAKDCRQKFVILITDGSDTYGCGADGSECDPHRYKNRREAVAKAKALADAGYRVFVIGFGAAMPPYLRNTLNWMAYYGRTDNPNQANSGSPTAYSIATGCHATDNPSACCNLTSSACYPTGVTGCAADGSTLTEACYDATRPYPGTGNSQSNFRASSNDPGYLGLSGYAFLAGDANELVAAVKAAITIIREATYSFSQASIQSSRTADENYIYEGSFQPLQTDPFWHGHLRRFTINSSTGGVAADPDWDAGTVLKDSTTAASRVIKTYVGGSLLDFTTGTITKERLAVATDAERDMVVGYIRGDSAYNQDNWKLGDVFRSTPITVGEPSAYFEDFRDTSNPTAFNQHRSGHLRKTSPYSGRVILVGANDGQLHAFKTSDGSEAWSFIPPNLLSKLKLVAHATEPSSLTHQYFVDGPVTVADAWIPGSWSAGTSKSSGDWKTLLVFAEGRGAGTNLWSSSASCDSGFNPAYTGTYTNYCGYYAMDVTSSLSPTFKWRLGIPASQAPYMGAPWSKMMVGRVLDGGNEKWVGFIGGGVYAPGAANSGKSFFVVDLRDGSVLWSFSKANDSNLDNPIPASPAIVDTDNDGFVDTAYVGDLASNMWRFKFCRAADGSTCTTSNWTGSRLFEANASSGIRPVYTLAAVAKDHEGNLWVYWGTGDKLDPTAPNAQEKIFALKDTDWTSTHTIASMQNVSSEGAVFNDPTKQGYYINMTGQGEKILSDLTVFGGVLYVTSFTPSSNTNPCYQGGAAKLYGVNATTAGGELRVEGSTSTTNPRVMDIGTGIPSAPIISLRPTTGTPDLYVTTSGSGSTGAQTQRAGITPPGMANRTNLLYWRDRRVE